ncbi:MAG: hypothetical protein AABZ06_12905, partial [Bdellovibrionota bacterium]
NPHQIKPKNLIAFMPGTGTSLPAVAIMKPEDNPRKAHEYQDATIEQLSKKRSDEWKRLPKQRWETFEFAMPAEVDPHGIDRRSKITFKTTVDFNLEAIVSSEEFELQSSILASHSPSENLVIGDNVYIDSSAQLTENTVFAVTEGPTKIKASRSGRTAYSYYILGTIKITGVRDSMYIGTVLSTRHFIPRRSYLIPLPARAKEVKPIAAPKPLRGEVVLDHSFSTSVTSQQKQVYIDLGSNDGVTEGMVFRAYHHIDPATGKTITRSHVMINADMMAVQISKEFSTAIVLSGGHTISEQTPVVLLNDVSDVRKSGFQKAPIEALEPGEEELESLGEGGSETSEEEKKELEQLEEFQEAPPEEAPSSELPATEEPPVEPPAEIPAPEGTPPPDETLPPLPEALPLPPEEAPPADLEAPPAETESNGGSPPEELTPDSPPSSPGDLSPPAETTN